VYFQRETLPVVEGEDYFTDFEELPEANRNIRKIAEEGKVKAVCVFNNYYITYNKFIKHNNNQIELRYRKTELYSN